MPVLERRATSGLSPAPLSPLTRTDEFLAEILHELRGGSTPEPTVELDGR